MRNELQPLHFLGLRLSLNRERRRHGYETYLIATLIPLLCVLVSWGMQRLFGVQNGFLVFLLGVGVVAVLYGTWPSVWASCVSTALLAFFFMPPIFSFAVSDIQHIFTLLVMATIGIVISGLTSQVLHQADAARRSAGQFEALYRLSRELADLAGSEHLARAAVKHIQEVVGGTAVVLLPDYERGFRAVPAAPLAAAFHAREWEAAREAYDLKHPTGLGTAAHAGVGVKFLPLSYSQNVVGILAVRPTEGMPDFNAAQQHMLETLAGQLTGALERDRLSHQVQTAQDEAESERMRAALLSSVSHDLRTPLAVIAGSSSSMLDEEVDISEIARRELCQTIFENAIRLSRIVDNLLNMTRLESGMFKVVKQQHVLEEVVGSTLQRMAETLHGRRVETRIPAQLPMIPMDDVLFQQVLFNLLDNAIKYDPSGRPIEIAARIADDRLVLEVADHGLGLPAGKEEKVFEKFFRGTDTEGSPRGSGLGLTICRAIVAAHGGNITAENRAGGGALFRIVLPLNLRMGSEKQPGVPVNSVS